MTIDELRAEGEEGRRIYTHCAALYLRDLLMSSRLQTSEMVLASGNTELSSAEEKLLETAGPKRVADTEITISMTHLMSVGLVFQKNKKTCVNIENLQKILSPETYPAQPSL